MYLETILCKATLIVHFVEEAHTLYFDQTAQGNSQCVSTSRLLIALMATSQRTVWCGDLGNHGDVWLIEVRND